MLFKILLPLIFTAGVYFLFKSIGRILKVYGGKRAEFSASPSTVIFHAEQAGEYEIAYKRFATFASIPSDIAFTLESDDQVIPVRQSVNHFGSRKDLAGARIVPIASFTLDKSGDYKLSIPDISDRTEKDKLVIGSKTGAKGFLMIFAIIFSAFATISGLVLSILAFLNKI